MNGYILLLETYSESLLEQSQYLVGDAYFSKYKYVEVAVNSGFTFVAKLRQDIPFRAKVQGGEVDLKSMQAE